MQETIKEFIKEIDALSEKKEIKVISHFDTDGITSAAIFTRILQRWNKKFTLEIVKGLDKEFIRSLPEDKILIFLDLGSGSLDYLKDKKTEVFILDHHETIQEIPENVKILNPLIQKSEMLSGAGICYIFGKQLSEENKDLAQLAVIGMVGDMMEKNIGKTYSGIIKDSECQVKKSLMLYPSTRPLDRSLEYSSIYIPGVNGSYKGTLELLRDAGIKRGEKGFKALYELTDQEMGQLVTAILLRKKGDAKEEELIGNLYLINFFNKLEDSREISALINACSRMDRPEVSLGFCLGNKKFKAEGEKIYRKYRQHLVEALKYISETEKISGKDYTIINAQNNIKDTIIGTVASMVSHSPLYPKGTMIIALAYNENKIKVSARLAGREGRNVREILTKVVIPLGGEVGGHPAAAGCLIEKEKEEEFITQLKKVLEIESIKV